MKYYETKNIRNVALAGHGGSGKTSLVEGILYLQKAIDRLGNITDGNTVSDYDPEEVRRGHSISASLVPVEYQGIKINFLDLPGRRDFIGEIRNNLRIADAMLIVVDAAQGVEIGAQFAWDYADEFGIKARAALINKLDKEHADYEKALADLNETFPMRAVPVTLPVGSESEFSGTIDLLKMKFVKINNRKSTYAEIPAEMADAAAEARAKLIEAAAEGDDELTMKFLEDEPLTEEEILKGLGEGIAQGRILPVCCGSSTLLHGLDSLLALIHGCLPHPADGVSLPAQTDGSEETEPIGVQLEGDSLLYIYKTVSDPYAGHLSFFKVMRGEAKSESTPRNVKNGKSQRIAHVLSVRGKQNENIEKLAAGDLGAVAKLDATHTGDTLSGDEKSTLAFIPTPMPPPTVQMAIVAKNKADEDKVGIGMHRLIEQDPTLKLVRNDATHETVLYGMGDAHLDVAVHHLKESAKVEVDLKIPKVAYRETISKPAEGQGKYKKQSGGRGQYGDCHIKFEPLPEGSGFEFDWAIVGGVIPTKFQGAVEKGLVEAMAKGIISGHPAVDIKATCYDGSYHAVDSSDMAFKVAASMAFKTHCAAARPIILEPIHKTTVTVPEEFMGDIMGDMNQRRGRILGVDSNGKNQVIRALVPLSEMFTYSRDLRSMTRGAGIFEMEFDHYDRTPSEVQEKIVTEAAAGKDEG